MQALLNARLMTVQRGDTIVARELSLSAGPGDVVLLTGANGSGKTSVLRTLAGLMDPVSGTIERNSDFHWVSAQALPGGTQTAWDYLATQAALQKQPFGIGADVFGTASKLDIPLARLSTGWRQRVKLSRLLMFPQKLWLLDEPSDGLDADGLAALLKLLSDHRAQGGTAIIATHQTEIWPKDARRIQMGAA